MASVFVAWAISAAVLLGLAALLGSLLPRGRLGAEPSVLSILIDQRGRYSLSHFQIFAWTIVVLSLISGVFWGRLLLNAQVALSFTIPGQLLTVLGISAGSAVLATTVKSAKDNSPAASQNVAASGTADSPPRAGGEVDHAP
jgi:hypothetical protein